ncbi:MAG: winged helix-turn-helix transcriptional regulator [Planctomycetota bacterium]
MRAVVIRSEPGSLNGSKSPAGAAQNHECLPGREPVCTRCLAVHDRSASRQTAQLVPNATERMIALQLRELKADRVIDRHVYAEVPPRVEYEITEFGQSLEAILDSMMAWGSAFKARRLAEEADDGTEGRSNGESRA